MNYFSKVKKIIFLKKSNRFLSTLKDYDVEIKDDILNLVSNDDVTLKTDTKSWNLYKATVESVDPVLSTIMLFPGQGSQFVGMGKRLQENLKAKILYELASEYLNTNLTDICLNGPEDKLNKTIHCQPAIYTTSLAAMEMIKEQQPELIENCIATAGNSLGEITALVFAGVLTFEQGLHFVRIRAEHMQRACDETEGGLLTVFLSPKTNLGKAMISAKQYCYEKCGIEKPVCQISAYLFSECKVVGGHVQALEFIETFAKDFNIKAIKRLNVNGAFHTPLMRNALPQCKNALRRIGDIKPAKINVLSNVTGTIHTSQNAIKRLLGEQVCRPVLWEQILMRLYMRPVDVPFPKTVEIGPGSQIGKTVSRVNAKALSNYLNFTV